MISGCNTGSWKRRVVYHCPLANDITPYATTPRSGSRDKVRSELTYILSSGQLLADLRNHQPLREQQSPTKAVTLVMQQIYAVAVLLAAPCMGAAIIVPKICTQTQIAKVCGP